MELRLDEATKRRLDALTRKFELRRPDIVRLAIRVLAEQQGVDLELRGPAPGAHLPPADALRA